MIMSATPPLEIVKYINDPVYGGIGLTQTELELVNLPIFQRLRGLRQLALLSYVFPGAEHSRFAHSLGVLFIMGLMTDHLLRRGDINTDDAVKMRAAALLHDIGHYPLSHLGETVYGYCEKNKNTADIITNAKASEASLFQLASSRSKAADHELLGKYIVENHNGIKAVLKKYGLDPVEVGNIFTGKIGSTNMVYSQLLHSSLDADRLDYLLRDSYQTGVKYGLVDLHYLIRLLMVAEENGGKVLACNKKGQHVVEHFLMSRYFHYSQVVFHKTNVAFESLMKVLFIKLIQVGAFMLNSFQEIKDHINNESFLYFNDANLYVALQKHNDSTADDDFKLLYKMFLHRIRPKVIFECKDLYDECPSPQLSTLNWILKREPEQITNIVGNSQWGYHRVPIAVERIQGRYALTESRAEHEEELREAVRLYDKESRNISLLAEDRLSIINRLANCTGEFVRIFVFDENNDDGCSGMTQKIKALIQS